MTVAAREPEKSLAGEGPARRLFDVTEYYAMARAGILRHDEKLELIEGAIIRKHAAPPAPRLFNVDEYYAMAQAGILGEDDRVELIEGEIVVMSPVGSLHAGCVKALAALLFRAAGRRAVISVQDPLRLENSTEPEPDLAVLAWRADSYRGRHPEARDTYLVIEVADSSLDLDREVKLPLYARHGVPEVWLVDLRANCIERYRCPGPDGYAESSTHSGGDLLGVPGLDLKIEASRIVPGG
jgi:hypothetical protein